MKISILIPHWKTGKMTAYAISQLLKYKGRHEVNIIVVDNNVGDGSVKYLYPFSKDVEYIPYPKNIIQSHGVAFDYALVNGYVKTDYFITIESDSFPVQEGWLDYYELLIESGYDAAGSHMKLSGGFYMHPCGAIYKKTVWEEAYKYCLDIKYAYFPNMAMKDNFKSHVMIHKNIIDDVSKNPYDYLELAPEYKGDTRAIMRDRLAYYNPTCGPFHNGMGIRQESVMTYGNRTIETDAPFILLDNKVPIIKRVGYEPGQWLTYYLYATGKKVYDIPTDTVWMPGKQNIQQEYSQTEGGFRHLWGISAYHDLDGGDKDIKEHKQSLPDILYDTLPINQKINNGTGTEIDI